MNLIRQSRCLNRNANSQSGKIMPAVSYALVAMLFGVAVFLVVREPHLRENFSGPVMRHWLSVGGLVAMLLIGLMVVITVGVFACNPDWHTREGFMGLLFCLLVEVMAVAGVGGICLLIAIVVQLGR
jgi:hypothetical protein